MAPAPSTHSNTKRPSTGKATLGEPTDTYLYDDGDQPFVVMRFIDSNGEKTFRQAKAVDGKPVTPWSMTGITTTLYHQKEVENAELGTTVYVGEGEKDADNMRSKCGFIATTNPMGAGKWHDHFNEAFTRLTVVVIEDNDEAGRKHVQQVAAGISPVAASVKIVRFPDERKGYDISDFLDDGGTRKQLYELIENTPEWTPTPGVVGEVGSEEWGEMEELPAATPAVPTLPAELLPESLRPWLVDVAERAPVPLEFVAMSALSGLGSVIGRQVGIQPEQFDDYIAVANLWGAVVGSSGTMKSYAVSEGLRHVSRLEVEAAVAHEGASSNREAQQSILKAETDNLNADIKKALKGTDNSKLDRLHLELAELIEQRDKADTPARRFLTQDATIEKLGVMLKHNPNGLLISRDELAGWLQALDKAGRENDRPFYLESWNGTGGYNVDRIGRDSDRIPALTLTVFGSIQPGKLKRYVAEAVGDGAGSDGLLQRVQLLVYPDLSAFPKWKPSTQWADKDAKNRAFEVYKRLSDIQLSFSGEEDSNKIPALRFTPEAQELHTVWRSELEERLRAMEDMPAFQSHISKYRSLAPSLALAYYLADLADGEAIVAVPIKALEMALDLCDYLEQHARKVFAPELNPGLASAYALSRKILSGAIRDGASVRDIYRKGWSDLAEVKNVFAAVEVLVRLGWVRVDREGIGGQATESLSLHPELLKGQTNG